MSARMRAWISAIWIVLRKELLDGVRDRRSLFSALLYPLLGPLCFGLLFGFMADKQRDASDVAGADRRATSARPSWSSG